jgi:hypothetical protein
MSRPVRKLLLPALPALRGLPGGGVCCAVAALACLGACSSGNASERYRVASSADNATDGSTDDGGGDAGKGFVAVEASVVLVEEAPFVCPAIAGISINPATLTLEQIAQLGVTVAGPAPSAIQWTATPSSGGVISDPSSAAPTFRCSGPGLVSVAVQVGLADKDAGDVCAGADNTWQAATVVCASY